MNKIQLCVIQMKYVACISNRVNPVKCDRSGFFTVASCSVVKFDQSRIVLDCSLEELNMGSYFEPSLICLLNYSDQFVRIVEQRSPH